MFDGMIARPRATSARTNSGVMADGTADAQLEQSSGEPTFDDAALRDISGWRYAAFNGPSRVRVCEPLRVRYILP